MKKGISLIILTISIIVLVILAGTVIYIFIDNNPIEKAQEATFKDAVSKYKEDINVYKTNNLQEKISDTRGKEIKKYIPNILENHIELFAIEDEKLIYIGNDDKERIYSSQVDILTSRKKAPELDGTFSLGKSNKTLVHVYITGDISNNTYIFEDSFDVNAKLYTYKYSNKLKKIWKIEDTLYRSHLEKNNLYALSLDKLYKIDDKKGEIKKTYKLPKEYILVNMMVKDTIEIYGFLKDKLEILKVNKDTFELIENKEIELNIVDINSYKTQTDNMNMYLYKKRKYYTDIQNRK